MILEQRWLSMLHKLQGMWNFQCVLILQLIQELQTNKIKHKPEMSNSTKAIKHVTH